MLVPEARFGNEKGATMIEGAMSAMILFALIGAVVDFGLALQQYNYLSYNTNRAAREISSRLATSESCGVISSYLQKNPIPNLRGKVSWNWCIVGVGDDDLTCSKSPGAGTLASLRLTGSVEIHCFFICRFFPQAVTSTVSSAIDNPNVRCPGGGRL